MNTGTLRAVLLTDASADESTSQPINVANFTNLTFYVTGSDDAISAGVVTFEEADYNPDVTGPYSGTWSSLGTVNATTVANAAQVGVHIGGPGGSFAYGFVRARISTAVAGGTVSVVLRAV